MSSAGFFWPMAACLVSGLALYLTRGVLDQAVTADGVVRFAMLPPWQALVGFTCLAGLVLLAIDHLNAPKGTSAAKRPRLRDLVLPMFATGVLLLPYLPVLPDRWPALQALAGPLAAIVWLSVIALQVWVLWQSRLITARRNPNLVILSVFALAGRPDAGLIAVAVWTVLCIGFHAVRIAQAFAQRWRGRPVASYLAGSGAAA